MKCGGNNSSHFDTNRYYPYAVSLQASKTASIPESNVSLPLLALAIFLYIKFGFQIDNASPRLVLLNKESVEITKAKKNTNNVN